jgi:hypothetical protein
VKDTESRNNPLSHTSTGGESFRAVAEWPSPSVRSLSSLNKHREGCKPQLNLSKMHF